METKWIIIAAVIVFAIALIIYLIIRNKKDKDKVVKFFNETEIEEDPIPKDKEEI